MLVTDDRALLTARCALLYNVYARQGTQILIGRYADDHVEVDGDLKIAHKNIHVHKVMDVQPGHDVFAYAGTD